MRCSTLLLFSALLCGAQASQAAKRPSACRQATAGVEQLVCQDANLQRQDQRLKHVLQQALAAAGPEHQQTLQEEQRAWRTERDLCALQQTDRRACVATQYRLRTAELQARFMLIPRQTPQVWLCDDMPGSEVIVTHFRTDPPSLMAERDDRLVWMGPLPAASGSRYGNEQEWLWEHQGVLHAQWQGDPMELRCTPKAPTPQRSSP